ncbi:MAG: DUF4236 domain-containing protein [Firmicutes bacterium]|nr:DUF4236 domain-containing protein [Bacillota bacterium]
MSFRFRKSIRIAKGVRLNLSKGGVGLSIGGKGLRVGVGPRGVYTSAGIPGTGLYSLNYLGKGERRGAVRRVSEEASGPGGRNIELPPELAPSSASTALGCLWFLVSLVLLFVNLPLGVLAFIAQIAWAIKSVNSPTGRAKEYFRQGQRALQGGEWKKALESFLRVLEFKPDIPSVHRTVAFLYLRLDKPEESLGYFTKYLDVHPEDIPARLGYALALERTGNYRKAIEVLQNLPPETRQELPVINILAHAFLGLGRPELALEVLEKGPLRSRRAMDEDMKLFRYLLGLTYKELGEPKKALKQFQKIYVEDADYENVKDILRELDPSFEG